MADGHEDGWIGNFEPPKSYPRLNSTQRSLRTRMPSTRKLPFVLRFQGSYGKVRAGFSISRFVLARLMTGVIKSTNIVSALARFTGPNLTATLSHLEAAVQGVTSTDCRMFLDGADASREALRTAAELKRQAGQINVTIHALGILLCLPHLLEPGERVESVSLGAGNTGRLFDLETNVRVAEFKFINWRGGSETIRQNGVFKDYVLLALNPIAKRKHLYLLGTDHAMKFLRGGRAINSVLSRGDKLRNIFAERFGDTYRTVGDYYAAYADAVRIEDVSPWLSDLAEGLITEAEL